MVDAKLLLLFGVGVVAGFINVMAGGGSSLTLPALIFLGLEGALANGTNRIAIFLQNVFAVWSFRREKVHHFERSLQLALFTLPGAVLGALLAVRMGDAWFRRILAFVMIGIVVSILFSGSFQKKQVDPKDGRGQWLIYPILLGIGFYGGFLQIGVGFLFMAALYHVLRLDLVFVNMHKVFIVLVYTIPALAVFVWTGNVNWKYGLVLAAGNSIGAYWSAHVAVKSGEKVIRYVLAVAVLLMSLKLLGVF